MRDGFWTRHSWKFLLFLTTVIGLFGLGDIVFGMDAERFPVTGVTLEEIRATSEPLATYIDVLEQVGGVHLIVMSLLGGCHPPGPIPPGRSMGLVRDVDVPSVECGSGGQLGVG